MAKFLINLFAEDYELEVSRQGNTIHISRDQETAVITLIHQDDSSFLLEWPLPDGNMRRIRVAGSTNGTQRQLWVNGRTFSYERLRQRGKSSILDGSLSSSIPAIVTQIMVAPGDAVSVGEKLILLESMKMIIPIQAPVDGIVKAIYCQQGESVQAGIPLLELEEKS